MYKFSVVTRLMDFGTPDICMTRGLGQDLLELSDS